MIKMILHHMDTGISVKDNSNFSYKMRTKLVYTGVIVGLLFILLWFYRTSTIETNYGITFTKNHNIYIQHLIIEPADVICLNNTFLIIIVTSYVGHVELRSAHRRAMPQEYLQSLNATRIFLIAGIPKTERYISQEAINDESNIYGDILQGTFTENYRNLTHKHLMGLQWASSRCDKTAFILKVDDDTVFNLNRTHKFLSKIPVLHREKFIMGYILNNTQPKRSKQNKWYVTWNEYPRNDYPPYLSGWYYVISPKIAKALCQEALYHPYFWIDDIQVTGVLTEALNIRLMELPKGFWLEYYELLECCLKDMISKAIKCDYVVGPNGGRNNLIVEFNDALTNCDNWKNCTVRSVDMPLKNTCVVNKNRAIFGKGEAEIHQIRMI